MEKLKDKDKKLNDFKYTLNQKEETIHDLSASKNKFEDKAYKASTEVGWLAVENDALLKRNKELNSDIDKMHWQLKDVETHMHAEQNEWIAKYHD